MTPKSVRVTKSLRFCWKSPISNELRPGCTLTEGSFLKSSNGSYYARMQTDGNFVLYVSNSLESKNAQWESKTSGNNQGPYKIIMQTDNNLVIKDGFNTPIWSSNTNNNGRVGARLVLQNDRNLVILDGQNVPIWSTQTN